MTRASIQGLKRPIVDRAARAIRGGDAVGAGNVVQMLHWRVPRFLSTAWPPTLAPRKGSNSHWSGARGTRRHHRRVGFGARQWESMSFEATEWCQPRERVRSFTQKPHLRSTPEHLSKDARVSKAGCTANHRVNLDNPRSGWASEMPVPQWFLAFEEIAGLEERPRALVRQALLRCAPQP